MKNVTYINAGAGSGKTTRLTEILSDTLRKGDVKPSEVILTTFTEMAAAEFRQRARQKLYQSGQPDIANQLDAATIGTVHSVALGFIKKYWYLAGVSPDMKVMSEDDLQVYISQSLGDYVTDEDLKFFTEYCDFFQIKGSDNSTIDYNFWTSPLLEVINKVNTYKVNLEESKAHSLELVNRLFPKAAPTRLDDSLIASFTAVLERNKDGFSPSVKEKAESLLKALNRPYNYAGISKLYNEATKDKPIGKNNLADIKSAMGVHQFDAMIANLNGYLTAAPAALMQEMVGIVFDVAARWKKGFEEFKRRRHILDYDDMERLFLDLLKKDEVRGEIEGNYKLLMVDEFQDSSPIQLEIFQNLSDMMTHSYWVGDPKQSIYGFRGTDVSLVNELVSLFRNTDYARVHSLNYEQLGESFRTRPSLVGLANDCFVRAFNGVMSPEDVRLEPRRKDNECLGAPLSHWNCGKADGVTLYGQVAGKIESLMAERPKVIDRDSHQPRDMQWGDIAILCRTKDDCKLHAKALAARGIPVSFVNDDISQQIEVHLLISLLQLAVDASNKHVRANLLRLLCDKPTTDILNSRLDYLCHQNNASYSEEKPEDTKLPDEWMDAEPLFGRLTAFVKAGRNFSVSDLVESIVYGLSLPEVVAKWGEKEVRQQNLSTVCALARQYDSHCQQMGIGASVGGFVTYLSYAKLEPKVDNSSDAVKVLTYHKAKGLEWNCVILDSLSDDSLDEQTFVRNSFWGVRECRKKSGQEVGNEYLIQCLPRFISTTSFSTPVLEKCKREDAWKLFADRERRELSHLLYVGMTRARDYLITLSKQTSKDKFPELSWIKNIGISEGTLGDNASRLWGYNGLKPVFEDITSIPEADTLKAAKYTCYAHPELEIAEREPKFLSPSKLPEVDVPQEDVTILADLDCRIQPYRTDSQNEAAAGTCIHNIFAVFNPDLSHDENVVNATAIRNGNNMYDVIPDPGKVVTSIRQLYAWLEKTYGHPCAVRHEVPFVHPVGGQVIHGEMDLLWYLSEGECVLIDFKNFPGDKATITTPGETNEHYAGKYAAQLRAYRDALTASGLQVRDTLLYYSVMGCVVRLV